ncbi:MAG: phage holin [Clostridium sp.]
MKNRIKNIYFWLGLVGIVFTAAGVDFNTLTSWKLMMESLLSILNNPVAVMSVAMAIIGVFVNPSTPGISD